MTDRGKAVPFVSIYPKAGVEVGSASAVTQSGRTADARATVRPPLSGSILLVHGVNDVGVSYGEVERGLCAGLGERLGWPGQYRPASYRLPKNDDKGRLEVDPDAVFFKRRPDADTYSPVIPFYWGYREESGHHVPGSQTRHGQDVDRYGNRLDKDGSKGGGPFGNATSTLVDMWNRGFGAGPGDAMDRAKADPLHPLLKAPGRMYMVLAAERLAALVSMIRDYEPSETVSIVGHSQGCMVSLLAQALLMERGLRPADTLVLTHPPYSLVDDVPWTSRVAEAFGGGTDKAMEPHYAAIAGRQTMDARLRTLAAIVKGVAERKQTTPELHTLKDPGCKGVVGAEWVPDAPERDNRGKVYLYFCPEDMTVALENVQGIGWQGVPDFVTGTRLASVSVPADFSGKHRMLEPQQERRGALKELGAGFFQRVFTARMRQSSTGPGAARPVLVGAPAPYDFALRTTGEDDHAHVAQGSAMFSASSPEVAWPIQPGSVARTAPSAHREGIRSITGEPLKKAVVADLSAGAMPVAGGKLDGRHEAVDPIDAAISVTSRFGMQEVWLLLDDRTPGALAGSRVKASAPLASPSPAVFAGVVSGADELRQEADARLNAGVTQASQRREVVGVFRCLNRNNPSGLTASGQLLIQTKESADQARLRQQQHGRSDRSFHGAIFGSAENHRQVTAYDVAIGQGYAPSRAEFNAYLCAVADWRLQGPSELHLSNVPKNARSGILRWTDFASRYHLFYGAEKDWRSKLIAGNSDYYSTGKLPFLPILPDGLPRSVVSETKTGHLIKPRTSNGKSESQTLRGL